MRDLDGQPGAVSGAVVGADAAAVFEPAQGVECLGDDGVVGPALEAGDEGQTAVVVFERRIVEPDSARRGRGLGGRLSALVHMLPSRC